MLTNYWLQEGNKLKKAPGLILPEAEFLLALDFDGVFTKPEAAKAQVVGELGYDLTPDQMNKEAAIAAMRSQKPGLTAKEAKWQYESVVEPLYAHRMHLVPPDEGLIGLIHEWQEDPQYSLVVVTSRNSSDRSPEVQATGPWMANYGIRVDGVVNTSNTSKKEFLAGMRPLVFVDDSVNKLKDLYDDPKTCLRPAAGLEGTAMALYYNDGNRSSSPVGLIRPVDGASGLKELVDGLVREYR